MITSKNCPDVLRTRGVMNSEKGGRVKLPPLVREENVKFVANARRHAEKFDVMPTDEVRSGPYACASRKVEIVPPKRRDRNEIELEMWKLIKAKIAVHERIREERQRDC